MSGPLLVVSTVCAFAHLPARARCSQIPGDVIVKLTGKNHKTFKRIGDNLHVEFTIPLKDALLGFSKTITQLDGRPVEVTMFQPARGSHSND